MSPKILDCKGLPCPGPVLRCIEAIEKDAPAALAVLVDDPAALENVSRLLSGKGYAVSSSQDMDTWTVNAVRTAGAQDKASGAGSGAAPEAAGQSLAARTAVFITADVIGAGDGELGGKLMLNFLATLPELGPSLWRVVLVNGGVKLACQGHPCLEKLQALAQGGVSILVCGTCLGFFGLMEQKQVGETTNMLDVVTSLGAAGKVIQV